MYRSVYQFCRMTRAVMVMILGSVIEAIRPTTWGELPESVRRTQKRMLCPDCCGQNPQCLTCRGLGDVCAVCRRSLDRCLCMPER